MQNESQSLHTYRLSEIEYIIEGQRLHIAFRFPYISCWRHVEGPNWTIYITNLTMCVWLIEYFIEKVSDMTHVLYFLLPTIILESAMMQVLALPVARLCSCGSNYCRKSTWTVTAHYVRGIHHCDREKLSKNIS